MVGFVNGFWVVVVLALFAARIPAPIAALFVAILAGKPLMHPNKTDKFYFLYLFENMVLLPLQKGKHRIKTSIGFICVMLISNNLTNCLWSVQNRSLEDQASILPLHLPLLKNKIYPVLYL